MFGHPEMGKNGIIIIGERRVWTDREVGNPEPKAGRWSLVGLTHREGYWIGSERGVVSRPAWRSLNFPWETAL